MFHPGWLILRILHQSFEIERPKGHWSEVVVHLYFQLFVGVLCWSLFCYALLCVHSIFAIILKRKRKLVALLVSSYRCFVTITVLWLFLAVPWVGLQCEIVVFPHHTHLLFGEIFIKVKKSKIRRLHFWFINFIS